MATYQTGAAELGHAFVPFPQGTVAVRAQTFSVDTALALNDVIEMIPVYEGERVVDLILLSDDLDTNGTPTIDLHVGDGVDPDRYIAASDVGQAGGRAPYGEGLASEAAEVAARRYVYTADDTIDITVSTGPATGATSVDITLIAHIAHS